ncbi:MAG: hypothetical protein ACRDRO_27690 [Pseudonocardiaceae bacterium]
MRIKNVLLAVVYTGVALGTLTFPAYADHASGGPIPVSGPVQMVSLQDCLNGGGRPNYFGSHAVCEGGSHNGEYINN